MISQNILDAALGGLLHDIGKMGQRTVTRSDLTEQEKYMTPVHKIGYHTHLHAGYTSRFLQDILKQDSKFEAAVSSHHLNPPLNPPLSRYIQDADRLAAQIDRDDDIGDTDQATGEKSSFQQVRLNSIFSEIDFGQNRKDSKFRLSTLSSSSSPETGLPVSSKKEAAEEYAGLYQQLIDEILAEPQGLSSRDRHSFDRILGLLYEYASLVPASTYEGDRTFVSLYDHSKLTAAIGSCYAASDSDCFRLLEFDISGIQNFIFQVTEGGQQKTGIAKALRGRSLFISLVTDFIVHAYLHAFGMTQANILFSTGGGALLLLPDTEDYDRKLKSTSQQLLRDLFDIFHTDITYVYASIRVTRDEFIRFKPDKAIELKSILEEEKTRKFSEIAESELFHEEPSTQKLCPLCEHVFTTQDICPICDIITRLSDFFVKNDDLYVVFSYSGQPELDDKDGVTFDIGPASFSLVNTKGLESLHDSFSYVETINRSRLGLTRYIANDVPLYPNGKSLRIQNFEEIAKLAPEANWGDPKLAILKMDVDNLGAIFAYGLPRETRSISKFLTLSRLMEVFFGKQLPEICQDVSLAVNPDLDSATDTMFYIDYAGGDDLVIIGPAAGILRLADEIHSKFLEFTHNENLTISGGIFIQRPQEPVRFGIQKAEGQLELSKSMPDKNSLTLLSTSIPFSQYHGLLQTVDACRGDIRENRISRTNFYRLMSVLDVDDFNEFSRRVPVLLYSLSRTVQDPGCRNHWVREISAIRSPEDMPALCRLVLIMKLAIMETREE